MLVEPDQPLDLALQEEPVDALALGEDLDRHQLAGARLPGLPDLRVGPGTDGRDEDVARDLGRLRVLARFRGRELARGRELPFILADSLFSHPGPQVLRARAG